ncbi:hypothetical protein L3Q82_021988 [Scortum barcoo]|uniref:Uncharacterized protein n=1 Tax=Scortum barcoo TaxID=214431 RepID=A0ACB8X1U4_9TELE|nr:hypothetical protein L3Q82_021988 [Scortum barcoo]
MMSRQRGGGGARFQKSSKSMSSAYQREKKRGEWGRERRAARERGRGEMEETMVTRQGWWEDDAQRGPWRGRDWKNEQRDDGYRGKTDYLQWMCRCRYSSGSRQDLLR